MAASDTSADDVVAALRRVQSDAELVKVRTRLEPGEEAIGVRMGDLFATAKAHTDLSLDEVNRLLDHPAYEPRMAALCIMDFKARRRLDDAQRRELFDVYVGRHDRITTWDMVDRAAPRVVGGHLSGRSVAPLLVLAMSPDPLQRRTAVTAPLYFVRAGTDADVDGGFEVAGLLAGDGEPVVSNAVGIFLKHAGTRDPAALHAFLATHAATMRRPALRLAVEKLASADRARYLS